MLCFDNVHYRGGVEMSFSNVEDRVTISSDLTVGDKAVVLAAMCVIYCHTGRRELWVSSK